MRISCVFAMAFALMSVATTLRADDELKDKDDRDFSNPVMVTSYIEAHYPSPQKWNIKYECVKEAKGLVLTVRAEAIDNASFAEATYQAICRYIGHCLHYRAPIHLAHFHFGPAIIQAPLPECLLIARAKTSDDSLAAFKKFRAAYDWKVVTEAYRNRLRQLLVEQKKILRHEAESVGYLEREIFEITKIIDRNNAIVSSMEKDKPALTYWLKNFPTHKYSDGDTLRFDYTTQLFKYCGTNEYIPKLGAKRLLHAIEITE